MRVDEMLHYIPFNLDAIERSEKLLPWIWSWFGSESELLSHEDWFVRGHNL